MSNDFATRLRELREKTGRSQTELSIAAGLSKGMVQQIESGALRSTSLENAKNLAKALGVSLSYLVSGETGNQPSPGFAESAVLPWQPPRFAGERPDLIENLNRLVRTLAPYARTPASFQVGRHYPGFAFRSGDVLIIDQAAKPEAGDLVLAQVVDYQTGTGITVLRRLLPPYLLPDQHDESEEPLLADGHRTSIMGPIVASFRSPYLDKPRR